MNKEVTTYITKQSSPQKEICTAVRKIIFKTFPKITEEMKWGVPAFAGGKFYLASLKDSVNLGFSVVGLSEDEKSNFKGVGKLMRHLKFRAVDEVDRQEITRLLKLVDKKATCEGL